MTRPRLDHVRKAQILAAAATVLSERGYANTRVVDIAKAAGTSPAAILYWFEGKDGLLAQALDLRQHQFHQEFTEMANGGGCASDRLRLLVGAMLHHYDWALWMELCVRALRDEVSAAARQRIDDRWRSVVRDVIRDGQASGEFTGDDADEAMFVLLAVLDGLAPLLALRAQGVSVERAERTWLAEARRLLGPGFDDSPLTRQG
jgi:AcrR family transcriptional regulator